MYSLQVFSSFAIGSHSFRVACLLDMPLGSMFVMVFAKLLLHDDSWGAPVFLGWLIPVFRKSLGKMFLDDLNIFLTNSAVLLVMKVSTSVLLQKRKRTFFGIAVASYLIPLDF